MGRDARWSQRHQSSFGRHALRGCRGMMTGVQRLGRPVRSALLHVYFIGGSEDQIFVMFPNSDNPTLAPRPSSAIAKLWFSSRAS